MFNKITFFQETFLPASIADASAGVFCDTVYICQILQHCSTSVFCGHCVPKTQTRSSLMRGQFVRGHENGYN